VEADKKETSHPDIQPTLRKPDKNRKPRVAPTENGNNDPRLRRDS